MLLPGSYRTGYCSYEHIRHTPTLLPGAGVRAAHKRAPLDVGEGSTQDTGVREGTPEYLVDKGQVSGRLPHAAAQNDHFAVTAPLGPEHRAL